MRELLAFIGLGVPMKYVDQFGMEGVAFRIYWFVFSPLTLKLFGTANEVHDMVAPWQPASWSMRLINKVSLLSYVLKKYYYISVQ